MLVASLKSRAIRHDYSPGDYPHLGTVIARHGFCAEAISAVEPEIASLRSQ